LRVPPSLAGLQEKLASRSTPSAQTGGIRQAERVPRSNAHRRKRILFYAINGNGLGHVVRLSVIAEALKDHAEVAFYSNSRFADQYWPGKIFAVTDRPNLNPEQRILHGFCLALAKFSPEVVVCDTHWPQQIIRQLRAGGIRTVLVLRTLTMERMERALQNASQDFSSIVIPHHPAELASLYGAAPELLERLTAAPCVPIGPVARTTAHSGGKRSVIFTLGGGGEYWNPTQANSVEMFIREYRSVATALRDRFGVESIFAAGPLLDRPDESLLPFKIVRSTNLHEMFGPDTLVVTRGGYNTCWEAVAAGARLVIVGDHSKIEDIGARARFLAAEDLGRHVGADASEILEACTDLIERPVASVDHYLRQSVNSGLPLVRDEIIGPSDLPDYARGAFWILQEFASKFDTPR